MNNYQREDVFDRIALFLMHAVPFVFYCLLALCSLKVVLFVVNRRRSWKLQNLVYFNQSHIMFSTNDKSIIQKKVQNMLSRGIVMLLCILLTLKLMLAQVTQ
jgi:hypothetical protein